MAAIVIRTLYRNFLRHSRHFDRVPLLKVALRRPLAASLVPKPPQLTLFVVEDKVIPIVSTPPVNKEAPPEMTLNERLADAVWSDVFSSTESLFYRPSVKFTTVAQKWFKNPPILEKEPNITTNQLLEAGFSVLKEVRIQSAQVLDSKLVQAAKTPKSKCEIEATTSTLWAKPTDPNALQPGMCLISHPAMAYSYFNRTVILLTQQHASGGWRGLILNRLFPLQANLSESFRNGPRQSKPNPEPEKEPQEPNTSSASENTTESTPPRRGVGRRGRGRDHFQNFIRQIFSASPLRVGGPVPSGLQYLHRWAPQEEQKLESTDTVPQRIPSTQEEEEADTDALELNQSSPDGMIDSSRVTDTVFWGFDSQLDSFLRYARKSVPTAATAALTKTDAQAVTNAAKEFIWVAHESSWAPGQLERELRQGYYFTARLSDDLLFSRLTEEGDSLWQTSLRLMGDEYASIAAFPADLEPQNVDQQEGSSSQSQE